MIAGNVKLYYLLGVWLFSDTTTSTTTTTNHTLIILKMRTTATSIINVQQRWNLQDEHSLGSLVALLAEWILCWCEYFALFRPFKLVAQPRVRKFF